MKWCIDVVETGMLCKDRNIWRNTVNAAGMN